jgi:hypothetical protein
LLADEASREAKLRPKLRSHASVNPSGEGPARSDIAWIKLEKALRELRSELLEIRALLGKLLEG